ncbi:hypothetical protein KIN20_001134 [Parelaphostrongylus tenuis]|uniref:Uncharacterized protein n=1 Tax=Parelaphostrongylus tenuis TaxID=148309 RepID=A0AAD5LXN2_PARTN|nr:hypothetical protein KIN20_001134 [Parelaphostrongylus tenuis]
MTESQFMSHPECDFRESRKRPSTGLLSRLIMFPDHQRRSAVHQTIGRGQTRDTQVGRRHRVGLDEIGDDATRTAAHVSTIAHI